MARDTLAVMKEVGSEDERGSEWLPVDDGDDHFYGSAHDAITAPEGAEADLDDLPPDDRAVDGRFLDFTRGGLESLGWRAAEIASLQLSPLGPVVVRSLYLSRQALQAVRGVTEGEGFYLKVTVPGLAVLGDTGPFELAAYVRLGQTRPDAEGGADIRPDIQFFEPWFEDLDVHAGPDAHRRPPARRRDNHTRAGRGGSLAGLAPAAR